MRLWNHNVSVAASNKTQIGDGASALVLEEAQYCWRGLDVTFRSDDIRKPTDWRIQSSHHSVVVHLAGRMDRLETEVDGAGGSTGSALPGEVWSAPAERSYASHACGKTINYAVFRVQADFQDQILPVSRGRQDLRVVAGRLDRFLHQATLQLHHAVCSSDDVSAIFAESLSQTIGLHILHSLAPTTEPQTAKLSYIPGLTNSISRRLRERIHDNLEERIRITDLAEIAELTTHQFLIAFKRTFGITPAQYIIQQRLRAAQRQLLSTRKDITTIALDCGFASHSHLTSCFSQHLGCSPSTYRNSAKQFSIPRMDFVHQHR